MKKLNQVVVQKRGDADMHVQDKRAVEAMCWCGLSLEGLLKMFPMFRPEEVESIFLDVLGKKIEEVTRRELIA